MEKIVELNKISKSFGAFHAVNELSLEVQRGDVFGFLGPNGAGKSTTMRMMLSLIEPTEGAIKIFGQELSKNRNEIMRRIGCIIEKPDFYLYMSAEKNLEIFCRLSGVTPSKNKVHEVLELVGLKGREKDKVKTYSHGMKQRLGIAQTLIHDPELIILDEPTTGLDPQGIIDIREMILRLKTEMGKTIILSSHILSEIELVANRMIIINKGKEIVQGEVATLLSSQNLVLTIEVDDSTIDSVKLKELNFEKMFQHENGKLQFNISRDEIPEIVSKLNSIGIKIFSVSYRRALEEYFLKLTTENYHA
ncbi:MAG: ABC transporter ATP-binding protein [Bacteroidota bacterium]